MENNNEMLNQNEQIVNGPITLPVNDNVQNNVVQPSPVVEPVLNEVPLQTPEVQNAVESPVVDSVAQPSPVVEPVVVEMPTINQEPVQSEPISFVESPSISQNIEQAPLEVNMQPEITPSVVTGPEVQMPVAPVQELNLNQTDVPAAPVNNVVSPAVEPIVAPVMPVAQPVLDQVPNPDAFQAQSTPTEPINTNNRTLQVDPTLNVAPIAPAPVEPTVEPKKKKGKGGILVVILLLLVAIAAGIFAFFKFFYFKPEKTFSKVLNVYQANVEKLLNRTVAPAKSIVTEEGSLSIDSSLIELQDLKKYGVNYKLGFDLTKGNVYGNVDLSEETQKVLTAIAYITDNKVYMSSKELYDKVLFLGSFEDEIDLTKITENIKTENIVYIVNSVNKYLIKSLNNAKYSSNETSLSIGNSKVKVTDNVMIIDETNIGKIVKSFVTNIKNDSKLIDNLAELTNTDASEITSYLDQILAQDFTNIGSGKIRIDLYTKMFSDNIYGIKVSVNEDTIIDMKNDGKTMVLDVYNYLNVKSVTTDNVTYNVTISMQGQELLNVKVTKNSVSSYTFETTYNDFTIKVTVGYEENGDIVSKQLDFSMERDKEHFTIKYSGSTNYNATSLDTLNTSSAVDINSLDSAEKKKVYENLDKLVQKFPALGSIMNISTINYGNNITDIIDEELPEDDNVPEACSYATCNECSGNTCSCTYLDDDFKRVSITCPRNY